MSTADLDHNDKLLAKEEKLEWVTPKISLMGAADSEGKMNKRECEASNRTYCTFGAKDYGPS